MATSKTSKASLRLATIGLAVAVGAATAVGASGPAAASPSSAPVKYTAKVVGSTVQINVDRGGFSVERGNLFIHNASGTPVLGYPLSYVREGRSYPITATTSGTTATLTPSMDVAKSTKLTPTQVAENRAAAVEVAKKTGDAPLTKKGPNGDILHRVGPKNKKERDDESLKRMINRLSASMTLSSLVGMAIGALIGGTLALFTCLIPPFATCIPIIGMAVSAGSILGVIIGGGGAAVGIVQDYFKETQSPFKPEYRAFPKGPPKAKKKN